MWRTGPLATTTAHGVVHPTRALYALKRPLDILLGLTLGLATLPLMVLTAAISMVVFRAWPFFSQTREGYQGRPFQFVKIRSLATSAPVYADRDQLEDVPIGRWGTFIRSRHLDELPQFWLVVRGSMSIVGPRPMIYSICDRMDDDFRSARNSVRPGITGLWQVSEAGTRLVLEATHFDAHYVANASLGLDVWILCQTIRRVLGAPAASLDEVESKLAVG